MDVDVLATQGAKTSTAMTLTVWDDQGVFDYSFASSSRHFSGKIDPINALHILTVNFYKSPITNIRPSIYEVIKISHYMHLAVLLYKILFVQYDSVA